jgi:hypothetical protein
LDEPRADAALDAALGTLSQRTGLSVDKFDLFGFSGGAQFGHRYAMLRPQRVRSLHLASAGYYTFLEHGIKWPRGLQGLPEDCPVSNHEPFLRLPIHVYVGDADRERDDGLRQDEATDLHQGLHRVARGQNWVGHILRRQERAGIDRPRPVFELLPRSGHDFLEVYRPDGGNLAHRVLMACGFLPQRCDDLGIGRNNAHGKLRHFRIAKEGVDGVALLEEINSVPNAWHLHEGRQSVRAQRQAEAIPIRGLVKSKINGRKKRDVLESRWTAISSNFPRVRRFLEQVSAECGSSLGRAKIVRLRPGQRVLPHIDRGEYYLAHDRYHLILQSPMGSFLKTGPEAVRMQENELWWFDNRLVHEAINDGDYDRIHVIFDVRRDDYVAVENELKTQRADRHA